MGLAPEVRYRLSDFPEGRALVALERCARAAAAGGCGRKTVATQQRVCRRAYACASVRVVCACAVAVSMACQRTVFVRGDTRHPRPSARRPPACRWCREPVHLGLLSELWAAAREYGRGYVASGAAAPWCVCVCVCGMCVQPSLQQG